VANKTKYSEKRWEEHVSNPDVHPDCGPACKGYEKLPPRDTRPMRVLVVLAKRERAKGPKDERLRDKFVLCGRDDKVYGTVKELYKGNEALMGGYIVPDKEGLWCHDWVSDWRRLVQILTDEQLLLCAGMEGGLVRFTYTTDDEFMAVLDVHRISDLTKSQDLVVGNLVEEIVRRYVV
jgi:hypothetical protein